MRKCLVCLFVLLSTSAILLAPQDKGVRAPARRPTMKLPKAKVVRIIPATITKGFDCRDDEDTNLRLSSDQEIARLRLKLPAPEIVKFRPELVEKIARKQPIHKVRIHAIQTANDDHSQSAVITAEEVRYYVNQANLIYWKSGIEFLYDPATDFQHINKTYLNYDCDLTGIGVHLTDPNWDPNTVDKTKVNEERTKEALKHRGKLVVFFRWGTKFVWNEETNRWDVLPASGGFSSSASEFVAMPRKYSEKNLLAHEMGHYLHCPHPFVGGIMTVEQASAAIKDWVENHHHPSQQGLNAFDGDSSEHLPDYPYPVADTPPDAGGEIFVTKYGEGETCGHYDWVPVPVSFSNGYQAWYQLRPDRLNIMSYFKHCYSLGLHHLSDQQINNARTALTQGNRMHLLTQ